MVYISLSLYIYIYIYIYLICITCLIYIYIYNERRTRGACGGSARFCGAKPKLHPKIVPRSKDRFTMKCHCAK